MQDQAGKEVKEINRILVRVILCRNGNWQRAEFDLKLKLIKDFQETARKLFSSPRFIKFDSHSATIQSSSSSVVMS